MATKKPIKSDPAGNKRVWNGLGELESRAVKLALDGLVGTKAHRATVYLAANRVVRTTRRYSGPKGSHTFDRSTFEVILTIGRPNAREREFVKSWRKRLGGTHPSIGGKMSVFFQHPAKAKKVTAKRK